MSQQRDFTGKTIRTYQVEAKAGAGGQSVVYRAADTVSGRTVALKVIRPDDMKNYDALKRAEAEVAIMMELKHPSIVPVYETWTDAEGVWMVMLWCEGGSLRNRCEKAPLTLPEAVTMLHQIAEALTAAHAIDVIHRDIKPDNILFDDEGSAYLADFGAAKRTSAPRITKSGVLVGSAGYYPPEILEKQPVTKQVDIFSLGVVLYEALSGVHPFMSNSYLQMLLNLMKLPTPDVRVARPELPEAVNAVIQKATAKEPAQRYESAQAFAEAFRQAAESTS